MVERTNQNNIRFDEGSPDSSSSPINPGQNQRVKGIGFAKLEQYIGLLTGLMLTGIVIAVILQVVFRYFLNLPLAWTEELARYLMVWMVFLGASLSIRDRGHMKVDFFTAKLSPKLMTVFNSITDFLSIIFYLVVIWASIEIFPLVNNQISLGLEIPISYIYLSIFIGSILSIILTFSLYFSNSNKGGK